MNGLQAEITTFAPSGDDLPAGAGLVELMRVVLTNDGPEPLTLTPTAAIPIFGRSADRVRESLFNVITSGKHGDRSPRWSPDGKRLAFVSDQDDAGELELYTALPAGGGTDSGHSEELPEGLGRKHLPRGSETLRATLPVRALRMTSVLRATLVIF